MTTTKYYNCLNCEKEQKVTYQKKNKYCSVACQTEYQQKIWIADWKEGKKDGLSCQGLQTSRRIKRYIVEKFNNTCQSCGIGGEWNGEPLTLQLEHIDGNSRNSNEENLSLLCPNCHTQTKTYGSKNNGKGRHSLLKQLQE